MTPEPDTALDDAWARLQRLVDWTTDFYLAFIFSSSPEAVGILRDRSRSVLEKSGRRMRVFHPEKPADVLAVVSAIAQPESKKSNCFWLDTVAVDASDPTYELWREGYDQLILRLNESRQGLRTHLGGGLVLALPHWYKSIIAPAASDLWSIRTLTIDLPGTPAKAPLPSIDITDFVMPPVRLDEGPTLDPDMCKDQARRLALRGEGARPAMIANLLRAAEGYLDRDRARESLGLAEEAEALLQGVAPNLLGPDHAMALVAMAAAEEALGDFNAATIHVTQAIELRQGNVERDMLHMYGIAERIALRREDVRAAREAAEGALVVAKARHAESPQDVEAKNDLLAILQRVGPLRRALGDAQGARQAADEALELRGGVEETSMTRIEAIRPSAQLPPIVERLPEGEEGEKEFAQPV
ncbi:MAG: hypothetical protein IPM54_36645 [Polyangiaceae bacterium]|nr:hypothetical protein [Polyangiaceae bacterium]